MEPSLTHREIAGIVFVILSTLISLMAVVLWYVLESHVQ